MMRILIALPNIIGLASSHETVVGRFPTQQVCEQQREELLKPMPNGNVTYMCREETEVEMKP